MIAEDQAVPVRRGEEINLEALNEYLKKERAVTSPIIEILQFPGGYSNLTYLIRTEFDEYILRRPPAGTAIKSAHDMGREFKVLSLLRNYYSKAPRPIVYCESPDIIGVPFYVMERIRGIILRPANVKDFNLAPEEMRRISEMLVDNLAALHSLDIRKTGLDQLGKPEGYIQRQVEGWTKRYAAAETDKLSDMDAMGAWLMQHQPVEALPTLLHNDYKYDNVVLQKDNLPNIVGVLDWEMTTVGDPWMDLGAALAYWAEPQDDPLARTFNISWLPGNLTRKEVVERYSEKSGRKVISPVFYYVFGLYKNAVIAQQIYARWKQGHSKDPRFGGLIQVIRSLGQRAVKAVERNSI
jgi:aminoglycoside phosphotransferase (APT) family kinase protein